MKNSLIKIAIVFVFFVFFGLSSSQNNENSDHFNANENALIEAYSGSGGLLCWSIASECWFWNCYYITVCGSCSTEKADDWYAPEQC